MINARHALGALGEARAAAHFESQGYRILGRDVRRHSFKNHYLQLIKNETPGGFVRVLPALAFWEVARLGFALARDPAVLPAYAQALRCAPAAWRKRAILRRRMRERRLSRAPAALAPAPDPPGPPSSPARLRG